MNMIKFAKLIGYIAGAVDRAFVNEAMIIDIADMVQDCHENPVEVKPQYVDLVPMFNAMLANKKIEAIKEHRKLTGIGLKESKDEVERLINKFNTVECFNLVEQLRIDNKRLDTELNTAYKRIGDLEKELAARENE